MDLKDLTMDKIQQLQHESKHDKIVKQGQYIYKCVCEAIKNDEDSKYARIDSISNPSYYIYPENVAILKQNGFRIFQIVTCNDNVTYVKPIVTWDGTGFHSDQLVYHLVKRWKIEKYDIREL